MRGYEIKRLLITTCQIGDQVRKWHHLFLVNKIEFNNKVIIVLETSIQMGFFTKGNNLWEMRVIHMSIDSNRVRKLDEKY